MLEKSQKEQGGKAQAGEEGRGGGEGVGGVGGVGDVHMTFINTTKNMVLRAVRPLERAVGLPSVAELMAE